MNEPLWSLMGFPSYSAYLQSKQFSQTKERIKRIYPKSQYCWICDSTVNLNFHHERYDRMPKERFLEDLFVICETCHRKIHFDEFGDKVPTKTTYLRERRELLRNEYLRQHLKGSTFIATILRLIYRVFY